MLQNVAEWWFNDPEKRLFFTESIGIAGKCFIPDIGGIAGNSRWLPQVSEFCKIIQKMFWIKTFKKLCHVWQKQFGILNRYLGSFLSLLGSWTNTFPRARGCRESPWSPAGTIGSEFRASTGSAEPARQPFKLKLTDDWKRSWGCAQCVAVVWLNSWNPIQLILFNLNPSALVENRGGKTINQCIVRSENDRSLYSIIGFF